MNKVNKFFFTEEEIWNSTKQEANRLFSRYSNKEKEQIKTNPLIFGVELIVL